MQYDLVFEGGGAKGIVFVGALQAFEDAGHSADRLLGTSVGSLIAVLVAAGYSAAEMRSVLAERRGDRLRLVDFLGLPPPFTPEEIRDGTVRKLLAFHDLPWVPDSVERRLDDWIAASLLRRDSLRHLFAFIERGGMYDDVAFTEWVREKLDAGSFQGQTRNFGVMTLTQFHEATGREVSLVAADITDARMLILNHRTAPDCPLVDAVRMSTRVPFMWAPVQWQRAWGHYHGYDLTGHNIADGALISNFPIELLLTGLPEATQLVGPKQHGNVMGLLIDEDLPVPGATPARSEAERARLGVEEFGTARIVTDVLNTMLQAKDKTAIEAVEPYLVRLPARGFTMFDFDLSEARWQALVAAGHNAMRRHLAERAAPAAEPAPQTATELVTHLVNRVARRQVDRVLAQPTLVIDTGGGDFVVGDKRISGDEVRGDKVGGDKVGRDKVGRAPARTTARMDEIETAELDALFVPVLEEVERADKAVRYQALEHAFALKGLCKAGVSPDRSRLAERANGLLDLVPGACRPLLNVLALVGEPGSS